MKRIVTVIFTCFNRKSKTIKVINDLVNGNPSVKFKFIIVDDNSTDGTSKALKELNYDIHLIQGNGNLFWCGGMRLGINHFISTNPADDEYCMFINDDVDFFKGAIDKLIDQHGNRESVSIVGATCDEFRQITYGLQKKNSQFRKSYTQIQVPASDFCEIFGDTANANCWLIPNKMLKSIGNMNSYYRHSLGDFDFGYRLTAKGYLLASSKEYVGICLRNSIENTWMDCNLSIVERIRKKESVKGSPFNETFYFLKEHYGLVYAIFKSLIPYVRIFLRK